MVKTPTSAQLEEIARGYNLHLDDAETRSFIGLMEATLDSYQRLDELVEPELPVRYPRSGSYRPEPQENSLGAWYRKCSIKGASEGPLSGKRIAIKDNVCVAGIPMMNGSSTLEGARWQSGRPGRFNPDSLCLVRGLRPEADLRAGPLHRRVSHRAYA